VHPPSLADHVPACTAEGVGATLARALALVSCRARHQRTTRSPCAECLAVGRGLAPTVGRALFVVKRHGRSGPSTAADLAAVGAGLDYLEQAAGLRRPVPGRRPVASLREERAGPRRVAQDASPAPATPEGGNGAPSADATSVPT